ncbi:uncharacterized protein LOC110833711 isoform X3 [Zootermopsis nevadensis]|nr:uncharacterized protein LOC110833711 isoform X3 [Zootermopsis nevadensis]
MVILESISTFCSDTVRRCICCKKQTSEQTSATQTMSKTTSPIWTTDAAGYNGTSTITTLEAMSPACTGILNHNFKSPDSKHAANLPDVTAAVSTFPIGGMKLFYPQGHLCDDQQYYHNYKTMHDEWYFSGSFTEDPRRSKEVTEL